MDLHATLTVAPHVSTPHARSYHTPYSSLRGPAAAGEPPSYRRWRIQLAEWVGCVVLARVLCGSLVLLLGGQLVKVARVSPQCLGWQRLLTQQLRGSCCAVCMLILGRWRRHGGGASQQCPRSALLACCSICWVAAPCTIAGLALQ